MLLRKLGRELWKQKTQFLAIFLMSFLGLFIFGGMDAECTGAAASANEYYEEYHLADFWIEGSSFTDDDMNVIKKMPEVTDAQRCLIVEGKVQGITAEGEDEPDMTLQFVDGNHVSQMKLLEGESFTETKKGMWLEENFAKKQHIKIGDELTIKVGRDKLTQKVKGIITNPEYVFFTSTKGEMIPEYGDFGYAFLSGTCYQTSDFKQTTGKNKDKSIYHTIQVTVDPTLTKTQKDGLKEKFRQALDMDDLMIADRLQNVSFNTFDAEVKQHQMMSILFPVVFLFIAMLGIVTTMTRMTANQRLQIGTMKALGFSDGAVLLHYVSFGTVVSALGSVSGCVLGVIALPPLIDSSMQKMYRLPEWQIKVSMHTWVMVFIVILIATLICFLACRRELKEPPAKALRPRTPKSVKISRFETSKLWKKLKFSTQWNFRDIRKNKIRTLMGVIGAAGCMLLMLCALGCYDSMKAMPEQMYHSLNVNSRTLLLEGGTDAFTVAEYAKKFKGQQIQSQQVEIMNLPLSGGQMMKAGTITVVGEGNMLHFQDANQQEIFLTDADLMLSSKMADLLQVKAGDFIGYKVLGDDTLHKGRITKINWTPNGQGITMTKKAFEEVEEDFSPNQVLTNKKLSETLTDEKAVRSIQESMKMEQEMLDSLSIMTMLISIMIFAACLLGIVVLYNLSELSFVEKLREYTTLKVLGMEENVIRQIIRQQNIIVGMAGILLGIPGGQLFLKLMCGSMSDSLDMLPVITPVSYLIAAAGTMGVTLAAAAMMSSKVSKMNMVDALKSNE